MAILIPETALNDKDITPGETRLVRLLVETLDDTNYVWYHPQLSGGRRPDIMLYLPGTGLLIYEEKGWTLDHIVRADPDTYILSKATGPESCTNPLKQSRSYYYALCDILKQCQVLIAADGNHAGKLKLPVAHAVFFAGIRRDQYLQSALASTIDPRFILFRDDYDRIRSTYSQHDLMAAFRRHFDPWWPNDELTPGELDQLRGVLWPELTSEQRGTGGAKQDIILDANQENIARSIGDGHRIVRGIAGSGKSLVLCARVRMLLDGHPDWRILLTCYNTSLASQLRYYLTTFGSASGDTSAQRRALSERVEVMTFHQLCGHVFSKTKTRWPEKISVARFRETSMASGLKEHEIQARIDEMESGALGQALMQTLLTREVRLYDAILVDESQDFHQSWLKAIVLLLNGRTNSLLLAEDPLQKIYPRTFTYKDTNIGVIGGGRVKNLSMGYRSTREIVLPASRLVRESDWDEFYRKFVEEQGGEGADAASFRQGAWPQIAVCANYAEICDAIVGDIATKISSGEYQYNDFAVLYLLRRKPGPTGPQPTLFEYDEEEDVAYIGELRARFAAAGVPHFWLTEDAKSKANYDQFNDRLTISTIFSAKGLEFDTVYIVGLELFPWAARSARENASLLYVAMTRAKESLFMLSTRETETVVKLRKIIADLKGSMR